MGASDELFWVFRTPGFQDESIILKSFRMKNTFFSRLAPKESKFYPLLDQLAETLVKAADTLVSSLPKSSSEEREETYRRIKDLEHEGDKLSQKILDELSSTFITPFDREDIHDLASSLDDVIDGINSCAERISLYNPRPISNSGRTIGDLIRQGANCLNKAVHELDRFRDKPKTLRECCNELHDIENQADIVYALFIKQLFEEEKDAIEIVKIKDIMEKLEETTDAADHVGKLLANLIVKYA